MSATLPTPDLVTAADVIEMAAGLVRSGVRQLAANGGPDTQQVLAYDLAHAAAQVETARALLDYGSKGDTEARIFAAVMEPQLVSIAGTWRNIESGLPPEVAGKPAQVRLEGDSLRIEPLKF